MRATDVPQRAGMVGRQPYHEQLSFWRNPFGAFFTVGFSLVFLLLLAATGGSRKVAYLGVKEIQYYLPGFAAYGVMSACLNTLAISLVNRRAAGLLKRKGSVSPARRIAGHRLFEDVCCSRGWGALTRASRQTGDRRPARASSAGSGRDASVARRAAEPACS